LGPEVSLPDAGLEVGRWLGRREAFGLIASGCSAAEAETLRRIRNEKMYRQVNRTWEEFCTKRVGICKRHVDRTIRLLEEFGPAYFHVAQMTHVTADEYRAIAGHVGEDGVRVDGAVIALLPENSERVSAAVAELLTRERPEKATAVSPVDALLKRCESVADSLAALDVPLDAKQKWRLSQEVTRMVHSAAERV
jgi:hypothetical protein